MSRFLDLSHHIALRQKVNHIADIEGFVLWGDIQAHKTVQRFVRWPYLCIVHVSVCIRVCFYKQTDLSSRITSYCFFTSRRLRVWDLLLHLRSQKLECHVFCQKSFGFNYVCIRFICRLCMQHFTFIAQFGGRHEDLFHPDNSCRPANWAINCLLYRKLKEHLSSRKPWPIILSQWDCTQNPYYDVTALAADTQCREARQGDTTSGGRHDNLSSLHVTSLDQSYFFIRHIYYMRYNKF